MMMLLVGARARPVPPRAARIVPPLLLALALAGCGGGGGGGSTGTATASTTPVASAPEAASAATPVVVAPVAAAPAAAAPATESVVAPATSTTVAVAPANAPVAGDYPSIPSNFDVNKELVAAWGTGAIPSSGAPDVVGAFRFICTPSHEAKDDPIVFPGQPGRSHLHQFFGNTLANANSTYQSLRTSGESTCTSMLNRSAYWMPAMLNGKGGVVRPDYVSIYYKRRPASDPECQRMGKACVDLPRGLRFVFGYDMINGTPPTGAGYYNCQGPTAEAGHYADLIEAGKHCGVGNQIGAVINAPNCWDGKNLDSADHRSHVAYTSYGDWGYEKCPADHPYVIPTFTMGAWYTVDSDLNRSGSWNGGTSGWHLASDEMPGMPTMRPGSTFHADWFGAWDDAVMKMWMDNCINKLLNCSGGDLGNGKQMKMFDAFAWTSTPHVVPLPK